MMNHAGFNGGQGAVSPMPSDGDAARSVIETRWSRPTTIEETGLSKWLLADLACKHLDEAGVLDLGELVTRLALPGPVVESLLHFLREEGRVELRSRRDSNPMLRFGLTDAGRAGAVDAAQRDGYVGPAPIPLAMYAQLVEAQSVRNTTLTREQTMALFSDLVVPASVLDRLGPAAHSGRAIFIYGDPGTGKSYIARRLHRLLGESVLLPHAVAVGESVIPYLDPNLHTLLEEQAQGSVTRLDEGFDPRLVRCERPLVVAGGEMTLDMLELRFDASTRSYAAPLQLKANCGLLIIDDLGRQQMNPEQLLNRWILPMEERRDQLALKSGKHFAVPFDLSLVFSTNLDPSKLADDAFLRRIGYKIRFRSASREDYAAIWQQVCAERGIEDGAALLEFAVRELHEKYDTPFMQCYPRDLLGLASDYKDYNAADRIDGAALEWAWKNYFLES